MARNVSVVDVTVVPTPALSLWALLGLAGLLSMAVLRRRRMQD